MVAGIVVSILGLVPLVSLAGGSFFIDDTTSYVGIGNTTPTHRLDVSGALYSRLITATSSSINWNAGNVQTLTLSSNQTLIFSNGQAGGEYKLILKQDSTGSRLITWPASVKWPKGTAPALSSASDSIDIISFVYDGTSYYGTYSLDYSEGAPNIALDNISSFTGSSGSINIGSISSPAVVVSIQDTSYSGASISSVTVGGQTASLIGSTGAANGVNPGYMYVATGMGTGSTTVTISGSGVSNLEGDIISYSGVNQSNPVDQSGTNTNTGTSISKSLTPTAAGEWAITSVLTNGGSAKTSVTNITARTAGVNCTTSLNSCKYGDSNGSIASTNPYTQTWTSSGSQNWTMIMATLQPGI